MKKLKIIAKRVSIIFFILCTFLLFSVIFSTINTKTKILTSTVLTNKEDNSFVYVHFIHGSVPKKNCFYKKKRLGGYLGGHIEIENQGYVYGFVYDSLPINIFPKKKFNSKFEKRKKEIWIKKTKYDKITSIKIPINQLQQKKIDSILISYVKKPPFDYAFFGQRCTSATIGVLSKAGVFKNIGEYQAILAFYYPRLLRKTLIKYAAKNKLDVFKKQGVSCHSWE